MNKYTKLWALAGLMVLLLSSCGEFARVQQITDVMEKYSYAKKYYNTQKYTQAAALLEEVVPYLRGTAYGEDALYLQAQTYYNLKDYMAAQTAYQQYYTDYPNGEYTELARFYSGYGLAQNLPDPRLDQERTYKAIQELQLFLDYYPQSEKADEAKQLLFDMQDNLAKKALLNIELYYNLGNYIFNNYESAIITGRNAMKKYPYSKYKVDMHYLVLASLYEIAHNSVPEKLQERLRNLKDEYYNFVNEFPDSKYKNKVDGFLAYADKHIKDEY